MHFRLIHVIVIVMALFAAAYLVYTSETFYRVQEAIPTLGG